MTINTIIKYQILILICSMNISSCCKRYTDNNINKKNFNHHEICTNNEYVTFSKKTQKKMEKLQNKNVIYFEFNQYNILPQFLDILNEHARFLYKNTNCSIIIEGHTDERGTPEYNIALGERRANSVKMYLQTQGVLENQISIFSYGKEKPAVLGHSEKEYSKNRRAILVY